VGVGKPYFGKVKTFRFITSPELQVTKTEIYIMGYPVQIAYTIHHPDYVEWKLVASKTWEGEHDLLNVLLRVHYHQYIEAAVREHAFMEQYAAAAGHGYGDDDWPDMLNEDMPF
jgi:hypothetical protein